MLGNRVIRVFSIAKISLRDILDQAMFSRAAPVKVERLHSKTTVVGRRVSFTCESYEGEDVKFSWTRNGSVLRDSSELVIASNVASSTLTILKAQATDAGQYTCIASNKVSEDRVTAALDVEGM